MVVAAIGAAVWFAARGPDGRAGAVVGALSALASATAALTALHLSREALARTDRQLAHARRTLVISRHPLLLPVHQSVSFPDFSGNLAAHPPTRERFVLTPPAVGSYAFVEDTGDRFLIPVENAGEGPALRVAGRLWRSDGRNGPLVGPTVLGAGKVAVFTARLGSDTSGLPAAFEEAVKALGGSPRTVFYWLEVSYVDVFSTPLRADAFFDPRDLGAWHHVAIPAIEMDES
ncbi:hypothetical protein [Saccharothrix hoggarensis]|uniref:hypothetical protein n=1 Tax=Saccharothrix hoggarensis TaxID=913853 RepID=UPI0036D324C9